MFFNTDFNVIYTRIVQGCNLNCTHCFTAGNRDPIKVAELSTTEKYFKAIRQNVNPKKATFYLHGGETFLAPIPYMHEVCDQIDTIFDETTRIIVPQTNLMYNITDEFLDFLRTRCDNEIGVSWDYKIRFTTANQEALFWKNLQILLDEKVNIAIAITTQKHLLELDPIELAKRFAGVKSIDFELLTTFDQKTRNFKVRNVPWAAWLQKLVEYYVENDVSWSMPQVDMFTKSLQEGHTLDCKCNCCAQRTFTMNPWGSVGLCPDKTYYEPISDVDEMYSNWDAFATKALDEIVRRKDEKMADVCYKCEFFEVCGGNCEVDLFWPDEDECPLSKAVIRFQQENLPQFARKYRIAQDNLIELHKG